MGRLRQDWTNDFLTILAGLLGASCFEWMLTGRTPGALQMWMHKFARLFLEALELEVGDHRPHSSVFCIVEPGVSYVVFLNCHQHENV